MCACSDHLQERERSIGAASADLHSRMDILSTREAELSVSESAIRTVAAKAESMQASTVVQVETRRREVSEMQHRRNACVARQSAQRSVQCLCSPSRTYNTPAHSIAAREKETAATRSAVAIAQRDLNVRETTLMETKRILHAERIALRNKRRKLDTTRVDVRAVP